MDVGKASLLLLMHRYLGGLTKVYAWKERKKRFSPRQIRIAFDTLHAKGWLTAA